MPWMRDVSSERARATARASSVLPMPGTSSTSTWPSASSAIATRRTVSSPPTTARPTGRAEVGPQAPAREGEVVAPADPSSVAGSDRGCVRGTGPVVGRRRRRSRTRCRPCVAAPPIGRSFVAVEEAYSPGAVEVRRDPVAEAAIHAVSSVAARPSPSTEVTVSLPSLARIPAPPDPILGLADAFRADTRDREDQPVLGRVRRRDRHDAGAADGDRGRATPRRRRGHQALPADRWRGRLPRARPRPGPRRRSRGGHVRPGARDADAGRHGRAARRGGPAAPDRRRARRCG